MTSPRILATVISDVSVRIPVWGGSWECRTRPNVAGTWLNALLEPDATWTTMMHDLVRDEFQVAMENLIADGGISIEDSCSAMKEILTLAGGRPWWKTLNIIAIAEASWENVGGELAARGIVPAAVTLGAWLDAVWYLLRKLAASSSEEAYRSLVAEVEREPVGPLSEDDMDMSFGEFMAAASNLPAPVER